MKTKLVFIFCLLLPGYYGSHGSQSEIELTSNSFFKKDGSTQYKRSLRGPILPFLEIFGIIKVVMEAYDLLTFTSGATSSEVKEGFEHVNEQFSSIQSKIGEFISLITDESIRDQYASTERVIVESLHCYNAYTNMTEPEDVAYWKAEFLKWGSSLRESVSFLFDGICGRSIIASDILQAIVVTYKTPRRIKQRVDEFMGLINTGLYLQGAYVQVSNISKHANAPTRHLFASSYDELAIRVENKIKAQENESNVKVEMADIMKLNVYNNTEQVAKIMYDYLTDKYDTKWWFVMVYDPLGGFDNHCLHDNFRVVFRTGYKNAASISYPKSQNWTLEASTREQLNRFPCDDYNNTQNIVDALPLSVIGAAIKRNSHLFEMSGEGIQTFLNNNCNYATVIALPLPNGTTENDFHLPHNFH